MWGLQGSTWCLWKEGSIKHMEVATITSSFSYTVGEEELPLRARKD